MKQEVSGSDYEAALRKFGSEREQRHDAVEKVEKRRKEISRRRRIAGIVGFVASLALFAVVGIPNVLEAFPDERPYALGPVGDEEAVGLDESVQGLWDVRRELDLYRYRHKGKLPPTLKALKKAPQACPGCNKKWSYKVSGKTYRVGCPNPQEHGRAAIALDHRVGPPLIQLDASKGDAQ